MARAAQDAQIVERVRAVRLLNDVVNVRFAAGDY
jgi:hypothetical protein